MAKVNSNGINIEVEAFGNERDPAILLIMGYAAQMIVWPESLCRALEDHGFRVIRFDNRDCGLSTHFDGVKAPGVARSLFASLLNIKIRATGLSPNQFPVLRHLTYSAAPMPAERIADAQEAFGPCISVLYGQTEAPVTICALGSEEMRDPSLRGTVGKACCNSQIRVVDDAGLEVPTGTVGNVEAKGPIVMKAYLDEPELTDATIRDGWLVTGDLGSLDDAGYLALSGRASEVIITGGFNVYPAEIENVLAKAPGVRECCVFAVPDSYWGERIEAVIVPESGTAVSDAEILQLVKQELGSVRTPKALHVVDEIPRNAVGKVVRRDLPDLIALMPDSDDAQSVR